MSKSAIRVSKLGKCYRRGANSSEREFLGATVVRIASSPFKGFQKPHNGELIWALKNVSFEIAKGESVAFVGANGAGKSTLLKILSRITEPTEGMAEIRGKLGSLLELGTGFHPELTGMENIYLSGSLLGISRSQINRKLEEIIDFAQVEQLLDTPVKYYSSGQYVRLGFAVAAHLDREILLIDEILAVGDTAFQSKCISKMTALNNEGRTLLFVTHSTDLLSQLCNKTLWLDRGSVIEFGQTERVLQCYLEFMAQNSSAAM